MAQTYRSNMAQLVGNWKKIQDLAARRAALGEEALEAAKATAMAGTAETEHIAERAVSSRNSATTMMIIGLIVALMTGGTLALVITRAIPGPILKGVTTLAEEIAAAAEELFSQATQMKQMLQRFTLKGHSQGT